MENAPLTKIFIYEFLTGGGLDPALAGTVGLPGIAKLVREGKTMRDALVRDFSALPGVAVTYATCRFDVMPPVPSATRRPCEARDGEGAVDFVRRVAADHDYAVVVAPECDGLLLQMAEAVDPARWLGCTVDAIRVASSKRATCAWLGEHGVPVTGAAELNPGGAVPGSRWIVKPDDGAGGLDTRLFDSFGDALAAYQARLDAGSNPLLEAWVEGEPLSVSLMCAMETVEVLAINRQQITLEPNVDGALDLRFEGVVVDAIPRDSAEGMALATLGQRVAEVLPGLRGFAGIDVVWHPRQGPVVIEVNPRITVAYAGMSAARGRNVAFDVLRAHGVRPDGTRAVSAADSAPLALGGMPQILASGELTQTVGLGEAPHATPPGGDWRSGGR